MSPPAAVIVAGMVAPAAIGIVCLIVLIRKSRTAYGVRYSLGALVVGCVLLGTVLVGVVSGLLVLGIFGIPVWMLAGVLFVSQRYHQRVIGVPEVVAGVFGGVTVWLVLTLLTGLLMAFACSE